MDILATALKNCKCFRLCADNRKQITAEAVKYLQEAFQ